MAPHLEASLQRDIDRIRTKIAEMAARTDRALQDSLKAITQNQRQLAYAVALRDQFIDKLERELDQLCLEFLVRQQPVGQTLRFAYSAIKVNLELERVGDYAESIARQAIKLSELPPEIPLARISELADQSIAMLRKAVQSFLEQNPALAESTMQTEDAVDLLKSRLNKDLVTVFRENRIPFEVLNALMMITRHFERVSDQARNICLEALYMCTGESLRHVDTGVIRLLFVDDHCACRSPMAEAIGNALQQPGLVFESAGLDPRPMDTETAALLVAHGHDISRLIPKAIHQVPDLDHYRLVLGLTPNARKAFPSKPRKLIYLEWDIQDPSFTQGTPEQIRTAYESTYLTLKSHIKDLVQAVCQN